MAASTLDRLSITSLITATFVALALVSGSAQARKVSGVELEDTIVVGDESLILNGAGLRKRLFIKLYVGSLYLAAPSSDAVGIVGAEQSMAIRLNIISDLLTRPKMLSALKEGFSKSTGGKTQPIQPQIDQMIGMMDAKIKFGDSYTFAYEARVGTRMYRNGEELGLIEGLEFKQALFGIWLSERPVQSNLKKGMLKAK